MTQKPTTGHILCICAFLCLYVYEHICVCVCVCVCVYVCVRTMARTGVGLYFSLSSRSSWLPGHSWPGMLTAFSFCSR